MQAVAAVVMDDPALPQQPGAEWKRGAVAVESKVVPVVAGQDSEERAQDRCIVAGDSMSSSEENCCSSPPPLRT